MAFTDPVDLLRESCCTQRSVSCLFASFVSAIAVESSRSDPMSNDCDALSALPMPLLLSMDFTDPVDLFVNRAVLRDRYLVCSRHLYLQWLLNQADPIQ